ADGDRQISGCFAHSMDYISLCAWRRKLYQLCKAVSGWEIAVPVHKRAADHEHRVNEELFFDMIQQGGADELIFWLKLANEHRNDAKRARRSAAS
ncbi:MAG: hypothetical protein WCF84_09250, partial [Anaerolineae bacterium]